MALAPNLAEHIRACLVPIIFGEFFLRFLIQNFIISCLKQNKLIPNMEYIAEDSDKTSSLMFIGGK